MADSRHQHFRNLALAAGCLATGGLGILLYASLVESRRYTLESLRVITGGQAAQDTTGNGNTLCLKILHLSDLHLCRPETHKLDFLRRITDADYDLVVLTGDVFENESGLPYAGDILARPPRLGAYAVLGNHDYFDYTMFNKTVGRIFRRFRHPGTARDVAPFIACLEAGGFKVLRNSAHTIAAEHIHLVGIDYPGIKEGELYHLVRQAPPDSLMISLAHMPQGLDALAASGVHLALCGHTHGGQVCLPGFGAMITDSELPRHQAAGLAWRGNTAIHVSSGLGADPKTNFRLFCPPTATVLHVFHRMRAGVPRV